RDKNDVITEIFKSKAILVGSPTINKGVLSSIAGIMEEAKGLGFKNKKAAAFGAYGWSGESVKVLSENLKEGGFQVVNDGLKGLWNPDEQGVDACVQFGKQFVLQLK
ncbi:MAG TPA: flavodoxin domain-containing protein, partial [Negativicutes bacterium]